MADHLLPPYGGVLVDVVVDDERASELRKASTYWPSWDLTPRHLCDLELLLSGAFSPLRGFLGSADVASVCADMRLSDGTLWPVPVTLDVTSALPRNPRNGENAPDNNSSRSHRWRGVRSHDGQ